MCLYRINIVPASPVARPKSAGPARRTQSTVRPMSATTRRTADGTFTCLHCMEESNVIN